MIDSFSPTLTYSVVNDTSSSSAGEEIFTPIVNEAVNTSKLNENVIVLLILGACSFATMYLMACHNLLAFSSFLDCLFGSNSTAAIYGNQKKILEGINKPGNIMVRQQEDRRNHR